MARGKTPTSLLEDVKKRRECFGRRSLGLIRRAEELSALCAVPVAVVVIDADPKRAAAPPTVMETEAGVLNSYRALHAGKPKKREENTHLGFLEDLLAKEKAKLDKVRLKEPKSLALPHQQMSRMTPEELHGLLKGVEATLAATVERRRALGLPGDDDNAVVVVPPPADSEPWTPGSSESDDEGQGGPYPMLQQEGHQVLLDDCPYPMQAYDPDGGGMSMIPHPDMNMMMPPAVDSEPWTVGSSESDDGGPYYPMLHQEEGHQGLLDDCPYPMQAYHPDDGGGMSMIPHPDMNMDMTWMPPLAVVYEPWTAGSSESDDDPMMQQQQQQGQGLLDGCPYPDGGAMIPMEEYQQPEMNMNMNMNVMMQPPASYPQFDDAPVYMDGYYPMQQVRRNSCYYPMQQVPVGASSSVMMQGPAGNGNLNNGNGGAGAQGPAMWMPSESDNAIAEYPYMHTSGNNPSSAAMYPDLFTGDNNFLDMTMPEFPDVDMNYQLGGSYHAQG